MACLTVAGSASGLSPIASRAPGLTFKEAFERANGNLASLKSLLAARDLFESPDFQFCIPCWTSLFAVYSAGNGRLGYYIDFQDSATAADWRAIVPFAPVPFVGLSSCIIGPYSAFKVFEDMERKIIIVEKPHLLAHISRFPPSDGVYKVESHFAIPAGDLFGGAKADPDWPSLAYLIRSKGAYAGPVVFGLCKQNGRVTPVVNMHFSLSEKLGAFSEEQLPSSAAHIAAPPEPAHAAAGASGTRDFFEKPDLDSPSPTGYALDRK